METIELFSGTKSFSKVAVELGYNTYTIDNNLAQSPDLCIDFNMINPYDFDKKYNYLWASPPCQAFSVASIGRNWDFKNGVFYPKTKTAILGLELIEKTIEFISIVKPEIWYIENPRGIMRKIIKPIFKKYGINEYTRHTITYCQYGDDRMKPTDIFTNDFLWQPKKPCKNGDKCHIAAPRGSRTGTQGLKNAIERGVIPPGVFREIFNRKFYYRF